MLITIKSSNQKSEVLAETVDLGEVVRGPALSPVLCYRAVARILKWGVSKAS